MHPYARVFTKKGSSKNPEKKGVLYSTKNSLFNKTV